MFEFYYACVYCGREYVDDLLRNSLSLIEIRVGENVLHLHIVVYISLLIGHGKHTLTALVIDCRIF